jgi:hypothetical protein
MELLHVQGPKNNIEAVGDYLRAVGTFSGKDDYFETFQNFRGTYGEQLYEESMPM